MVRGPWQKSGSFTYRAVSETGTRALILSAEDYTGNSPAQDRGTALSREVRGRADREQHRVRRVQRRREGRTAPDALGVLSHYDAVLWYTGDDTIPRETYQGVGNASRLAVQELYEVREFLNEGGRAALHRQARGTAHTSGNPQFYDPFENAACVGAVAPRCRPVYGSGDWRERRARVLVRRRPREHRGRGRRRRESVQRARRGQPVRGARVGPQRRGQRRQPEQRQLVHHDERPDASGRVPAVRELGVRQVRPPRRAVRPELGRVVRPLPDRGRGLQAPDEHGHAAGGRHLSFWTSYNTEAGLGLRVRRGAHRRPGELDDAAAGPHRARTRATAARRAGGSSTRTSTTTRRWSRPPARARRPATHRGLERRHRQLRRLAAVEGRPGAYAGQEIELSIAYVSDWSVRASACSSTT